MSDQHDEIRAVDHTAWDGPAAMSNAAGSDDPAAAYAAICAGRREGDPKLQSSWALPHHATPGAPPNAAAVRNCEAVMGGARGGVEGLTNREAAQRHLDAHMAAIQSEMAGAMGRAAHPPRDMLVRSQAGDFEVREVDGQPPTLVGHFGVFDQWTEIDSRFEGRFMERMAPGAFAKALTEQRSRIKVTFQHGKDPQLGDQVLGLPSVLEEDRTGGYYEVPLFDGIPPLILDGLRKNAYGSSLRMNVVKDDWNPNRDRKVSPTNPEGLPERTIREAAVYEFGPVTYPAYPGATATVRSETDRYLLDVLRSATDALPDDGAEAEPHSDEGSREEPPAAPIPVAPKATPRRLSDEEWMARMEEIVNR